MGFHQSAKPSATTRSVLQSWRTAAITYGGPALSIIDELRALQSARVRQQFSKHGYCLRIMTLRNLQ